MPKPNTAPYGSWSSPITSDLIVAKITMLSDVRLDGDEIYWLEGRPQEQGRSVIVRSGPGGTAVDITPAGFNVRTRVHEYGGGAWSQADGTCIFSNFEDQRLYRQRTYAWNTLIDQPWKTRLGSRRSLIVRVGIRDARRRYQRGRLTYSATASAKIALPCWVCKYQSVKRKT
jgi:hypothetical protein